LTRGLFGEAAAAIGRRLVRQALWQDRACTWTTVVPDVQPGGPPRGKPVAAGGDHYQGTAGIALFLGELYRQAPDTALLETALGALTHALRFAERQSPAACGFHLGRVGIAYAARRLADCLRRPELLSDGRRILQPLLDHPPQDDPLDVISGAAGAIPALLEMAPSLDPFPTLQLARRLGDHLVGQAHREPRGWSWNSRIPHRSRNLCGLAHGASGFALALLELARATGDDRYRFAAEMAFLYERALFDPAAPGWPDLRRPELEHWVVEDDLAGLAAAARAGALPPAQPAFFNAWCHGACGIGLVRLRAFELTGQELFRREAEAAMRITRSELSTRREFSLCHGLAGFCELFLYASEVLGDDGFADLAREVAAGGCQQYEAAGRAWPSGNIQGAYDPGLMLGEAGIGLTLLRLAGSTAGTVGSIALLRPAVPRGGGSEPSDGAAGLGRAAMADYFGATLAVWARLGEPVAELLGAYGRAFPLAEGPAEFAYRSLRGHCAEQQEGRREILEDAFRAERSRYEATVALTDWSIPNLRTLARRLAMPTQAAEPWRNAPFQLAEGCRVLSTEHDWASWVARGPGLGTEPPPPVRAYQLLSVAGNAVHLRPLGPFAALLLRFACTPVTLAELTSRVREALGPRGASEGVAEKVALQVRELFAGGLLELAALTGPSG
jgi:hypothetical protein